MKQQGVFVSLLLVLNCCLCRPQEAEYKLCEPKVSSIFFAAKDTVHIINSRGKNGSCNGCDELKNCTTFDGAIQIQGFRMNHPDSKEQLYFPKLTEITGHLLVSLLLDIKDLKRIFPNLAVIRGRYLFLDYSLVIYQNNGLEQINLPSLTTILSGGVRIEKNINLCYVKTIRWKSIMKMNSDDPYALVLSSNNNQCYDLCYKGKCRPPAGHGVSGEQYCWSSGDPITSDYSCQKLCNTRCGDAGCVKGSDNLCCHAQCLGGCFKHNSPRHCYACKNLRLPSGECVEKCPGSFFEIDSFKCISKCPNSYFRHLDKCVKECPAGFFGIEDKINIFTKRKSHCVACGSERCPKVCVVSKSSVPGKRSTIDSISSLRTYKGCTVIKGNLEIRLRGGGETIARELDENLGMIEEVQGYIVIRESVSILSLKFFKNLESIQPRKVLDIHQGKMVDDLKNDRYALTIMDNPKLEALWDFRPKMNITVGGIILRMNPRLCPAKIDPLVKDILKWTNSSVGGPVDVSQTSNGNAVACHVKNINMTVTEKLFMRSCSDVCVQVSWDEVRIKEDYRNVLFYTVSYREAPHWNITEFDDVDACSTKKVWTRIDVPRGDPGKVNTSVSGGYRTVTKRVRYIPKLTAYTLYAFYVEAATLNNTGAKSKLHFHRTREMKPSSVVGLEANFLDSQSLLVKWQTPLFPNGIITKYKVEYQVSSYSVWKQEGINWCVRQVLTDRGRDGDGDGDGGGDGDKEGNCNVNITCDCNKEKEVDKPEKQAAIFAKEFQDALFKMLFTKDKDDEPTPTNKTTTITPTSYTAVYANRTNCSAKDQANGLCHPSTSTSPISRTPTHSPITSPVGNKTSPTDVFSSNTTAIPPTTPSAKVFLEVNGTDTSVKITGLRHFTDYTIKVCACTRVGCAPQSRCSDTKGRTGKIERADDLGSHVSVTVNNKTRSYNVSWQQPKDPNGVVLKYDVQIRHASQSKSDVICWPGSSPTWILREEMMYGNYSVRVRAITPAGNGSWSELVRFTIYEKEEDDDVYVEGPETQQLGVIVGSSLAAVAAFIISCAVIFGLVVRKRMQDKQVPTVLYASVNPEYMNSTDVYIADEWEVPRDKIKLIKELGNGSFGMVYEGEAFDIVEGNPRCRVAVKTVSENASIRDRIEFLQEASIMKAFTCCHVVRLIGVVSDGQPTLVIMELMENGDLKNFLRSRRPEESALPPPSLEEMLQMAGEIADGMAYLAARKFVHRDLAARNCMVNENLTVKIGDFGMTRDIYETDYYRKGGKGLLPVRWMAPESLKDGVFTSPSDVWSFGVVIWEMATLASQPYPGKSNEEVLKHVVDGGIMGKPDGCPDKLYDLMVLCWQFSPKARPTFLSMINILENELSEEFRNDSFYHNLPPEQLKQMLKNRCHHIPRQRAETVQSELESSTSV